MSKVILQTSHSNTHKTKTKNKTYKSKKTTHYCNYILDTATTN